MKKPARRSWPSSAQTLLIGDSVNENRALEAIKAFERMIPLFESFAEAFLGKSVAVRIPNKATPTKGMLAFNDGETIFIIPPLSLANPLEHDRKWCGSNAANGVSYCDACAEFEFIFSSICHEIAHFTGDSLARGLESQKAARSFSPTWGKALLNVLEDVRIEDHMFRAQIGTRSMRYATMTRVLLGIKEEEFPLNSWGTLATLSTACGYSFVEYPEPVASFTKDPGLERVLSAVRACKNASDVPAIIPAFLSVANKYGLFEEPKPEKSEDPEESDKEDNTDVSSEDSPGEESTDSEESDDDSGDADSGNEGSANDSDSSEKPDNSGVESGEEGSEEKPAEDSEEDEPENSGDRSDSGGGKESNSDENSEEDSSEGAGGTSEEDSSELSERGSDSDDSTSGGSGDSDSDDDSGSSDSSASSDSDDGEVSSEQSENSESENLEDSSETPDFGPESGDPTPGTDGEGSADSAAEGRTGSDSGTGEPSPIEEWADNPGTEQEAIDIINSLMGHDAMDDSPRIEEEIRQAKTTSETFGEDSGNVVDIVEYKYDKLRNEWIAFQNGNKTHSRVGGWVGDEGWWDNSGVIEKPLTKLRIVFSENDTSKTEANRRTGKVNTRALGKRAPIGDDRLFKKKAFPKKRDYSVLIYVDISGSTARRGVLALELNAVFAQAELLQRLGVKFSIVAHTGTRRRTGREGSEKLSWVRFVLKNWDEPWTDELKSRAKKLQPMNANLDGHALAEAFREIATRRETDRIIMYYSDGSMPMENYNEELRLLKRYIKLTAQAGIVLAGVGIRTDAPSEYGLPTVEVNGQSDIYKVVDHLEKLMMRRG